MLPAASVRSAGIRLPSHRVFVLARFICMCFSTALTHQAIKDHGHICSNERLNRQSAQAHEVLSEHP